MTPASVGWRIADVRDALRWAGSFAVVTVLHVGVGVYMWVPVPSSAAPGEALPTVLIDIAPPAATPPDPTFGRLSEAVPEAAAPEPAVETVPDVPEPHVETQDLAGRPPPETLKPSDTAQALSGIVPVASAMDDASVPPPPVAAAVVSPRAKRAETTSSKPVPKRRQVELKSVARTRTDRSSARRVEASASRRLPSEPSGAQTTASLPHEHSGVSAASAASWRSQLVVFLQRNLRYPPGSLGGGAASVSFSMNRQGRVLSASLSRSAGSSDLDAAALALFRAGGLPPPPPGLPGATFSFTIPIRFNAR